jgi:nicotinate-nucleotide--dimethylbenzimidazole phosphoribosyltransferase
MDTEATPRLTEISAAVLTRLDALAKPPGSLGRLEEIALQLALTQERVAPQTRPRRLVLFAADHGVVAQGVTRWSAAVTQAMVRTILAGRAASSAFARLHGVELRVIDCGMQTPLTGVLPAFFRAAAIARGSADLSLTAAMSTAQFEAAWLLGCEEAQSAVAAGCRVLIAGEMGIGNTTAAAAIVHMLTGIDADLATGHGAGADESMRQHKREIVAAAVARLAGKRDRAAIAAICGFEIAAMAGFLSTGAALRATLLVDGYVVTAAALIAEHLAPGSRTAMLAASLSAEPGHGAALEHLQLTPLLDWRLRLGEGTAALLALPLVDGAASLLSDVATLDEVLNA